MAKGGFPNMGGANMNNMLKQFQKVQKQMQDMQEEVENKEFTATVGGGAVTAVVNGKNQLLDIKIKPEVVDPDDVEMLQDLILTACNEALKNAAEEKENGMKKITGMPNIPGMF